MTQLSKHSRLATVGLAAIATCIAWVGGAGMALSASPGMTTMNIQMRSGINDQAMLWTVLEKKGHNAGVKSKKSSSTKVVNKTKRDVDVNVKNKKKNNVNVDIDKKTNVNVSVRHHDHGWHGARWGAIAFGVTMGAIITVAANTPPYPPDPSLCWTWTNSAYTQGYWYYCSGP
ncbi:MAG: hypothetical protein ABL907_04730 [Hyphomicrobium sp.]